MFKPPPEWPHSRADDVLPLPPTLPDGSPWPKISIVTPSLNQGDYIEDTILSVLNQGYPDVEHIVIDGESTDQTKKILETYEDKLAVVVSEPDEGQSDAINKGFQRATGEILTWLNADDMLAPGALAAIAMGFHTSGADLVAGVVQLLRNGKINYAHLTSCDDGVLPLHELLDLDDHWLRGQFFYQPEVMFTRRIWEAAGGEVDKDLYWSMDYDMWVRFSRANATIHVIGRPIAIFRVHEDQKTFGTGVYIPELREVCAQHRASCRNFPPESSSPPARNFRAAFVNDCGDRYGAGIAHARLARSLQMAGHEVCFVAGALPKAAAQSVADILSSVRDFQPDIVFIGNLHSADEDLEILRGLTEEFLCCQILHDLWPVTGRCAYRGSCDGYVEGCDSTCETADEYPPLAAEEIAEAHQEKATVFSGKNAPLLLANSNWMQAEAERSSASPDDKEAVQTIKLAHPINQLRPHRRIESRRSLGLPEDDFIVLFAACDIQEKRKGLAHLLEAFKIADLQNMTPVCFGRADDDSALHPGTISMGYLDDPSVVAKLYSAADVFVAPSLEESFGQVFVEAAACGTPSIAYAAGGVTESLTHGITGLLVNELDPSHLAKALANLHEDRELRESMSSWGRIYVENEWSPFSAYHRMNCVLRQNAERFGFAPPRSITLRDYVYEPFFLPAKPADSSDSVDSNGPADDQSAQSGRPRVVLGQGIGPVEGPFPDMGIKWPFRWATAPRSSIGVEVFATANYRLTITYANHFSFQIVKVIHDGVCIKRFRPAKCRAYNEPQSIHIYMQLEAGIHEITFQFLRSSSEEDGNRRLALLIYDVELTMPSAADTLGAIVR